MELMELIEKFTRILNIIEEAALKQDDLKDVTVRQFFYLDIISRLPQPTASTLAEQMDVSKPTVTIALNNLLSQGYIEKAQSEADKRIFMIQLTNNGKKICQAHDNGYKIIVEQLFQSLTPDELNQFNSIFQKLVLSFEDMPLLKKRII